MNEALQKLEIKVENGGSTPQGRVSAAEWNVLVAGVKALDLAGFDEAALRDYLDQYDYITRPELNKALEGIGGSSGGGIAYPLTWSGYSSGVYDGSAPANIEIPSLVSQLTNDSDYITTASVNSLLTDYLPKSGTATNADMLDNLHASAFVRTTRYPELSDNNWNIPDGIYNTYGGTEGLPYSNSGNHVIHCNWDASAANQLFLAYDKDVFSFRRKQGNVWQPWRTIAFADNDTLSPASGTLTVNGNILATGEITQHSSLKLKDVVDTRFLTLKELVELKPYSFRWKDGRDDELHAGAVADYVKPILPEVISTDKDDIHSMNYANAAWVVGTSLTPYVSKHEEEIERLKARVKYLESRLKEC